MLPTDDIVKVTSTINPTAVNTLGNFGTLAIIGVSPRLPFGARQLLASELVDLSNAGFEAGDPEYLAAEIFFEQSPNSGSLQIARRFNAATNGELLGGVVSVLNMAAWQAIQAGSLALVIDGVPQALANLDFANDQNLAAVAATITAAIGNNDAVVTWTGEQFLIHSTTTGINSSVVATPGGQNDLSAIMQLTPALGAVATPGVIAETITDTLTNLAASAIGLPYALTLTAEATTQNLLDAANWCEANVRIFAYTTADANCLNPNDQTNVAYQLSQLDLGWTIGQFDPLDPYAIVSAIARGLAVDFTQINSTITLWGKTEPGITPLNINETQKAALKLFNLNYNAKYNNGTSFFAPGVMADGGWFDDRQNLDWLTALVSSSVLSFLQGQATKLPGTDPGMAGIVQNIDVDMEQAVNNGMLAPGQWNGSPVGVQATGSILKKGYYVFAAKVASRTQAQADTRVAPPITIIATGAGAFQGANIALFYQQ
jgi:hypothetical protein